MERYLLWGHQQVSRQVTQEQGLSKASASVTEAEPIHGPSHASFKRSSELNRYKILQL